MKGHPLKYMWAYKYHEDYTGINTHADEAAVNVNIWLTPDDANLDPTSGGLVIFTAKVSYVVDFVPKRQHEHHVVVVVVVVCDVPGLSTMFYMFLVSHIHIVSFSFQQPPPDWEFEQYNTNTHLVYEALLKPTNFANVTVPHKQNRAVLFDSALFHHTDKFKFKKGHKNHRINLTLLYGTMKKVPKNQEL